MSLSQDALFEKVGKLYMILKMCEHFTKEWFYVKLKSNAPA